jgi:hypothetical protein
VDTETRRRSSNARGATGDAHVAEHRGKRLDGDVDDARFTGRNGEWRRADALDADALRIDGVCAGTGQADLERALVVAQRLQNRRARGVEDREDDAGERRRGRALADAAANDLGAQRRAEQWGEGAGT